MAITVELYERYNGVDTLATNIGWKSVTGSESVYWADYPVLRPVSTSANAYGYSFTRYHYLKFSGTYVMASRPRVVITAGSAAPSGYTGTTNARVYALPTNTYSTPTTSPITTSYFVTTGSSVSVPLNTSTVGPTSATTHPQFLTADTTYYTQFICTQLWLPKGDTGHGNIFDLTIKFIVDDYESNDP